LSSHADYADLVEQIEVSNISEDVLKDAVNQLVERAQAHELALLSIDVSEGRKPLTAILDYYSHFENKETVRYYICYRSPRGSL